MSQKILPLILFIFFSLNIDLFSQIDREQNYFQIGLRLREGGQFLSAKTAFKQALLDAKTNSDSDKIIDIDFQISLCDVELNPDNTVKIIGIFDKKYPENPLGIKLKTEIIEKLIRKGKFKLVLEFLNPIEQKTLPQIYFLAYSSYRTQDFETAKKYFQELSQLSDVDISKPSLYYLAIIQQANNNFEEVIKIAEQLDNLPKNIGMKVVSQEENKQINRSFTNIWAYSLFQLDKKPPYQSIFDLAEKKNIFQDKGQNIFSSDMQKFIAQLYFSINKFSESAKIFANLSVNPLTDSLVKFRQIYSNLKKPGIEKDELKEVIKDFEELSRVKSDSLKQHIYFNLADGYMQLDDLKSALVALDQSINVKLDTVLSRKAQIKKIIFYTKFKDYPSAFVEINKYLSTYKAYEQSSEINTAFNYLLQNENNLFNSIHTINELHSNNERIKLMFENYAKNLFIEEAKKNKSDLAQMTRIYQAAKTYQINKENQTELAILYANEIIKDPANLFPKIKQLGTEIFNRKSYLDTVSNNKPSNYDALTQDLAVLNDSLARLIREKNLLMDTGIQTISKYFFSPYTEDTQFPKIYFQDLAKQITFLFLNSDNNDFSGQSNIINTIFRSANSNDTIRLQAIKLYKNIVKSNPTLWNNYLQITNLQKLTKEEKEYYLYYRIWLKYQFIDKNNPSLIDEFYSLCEEYFAQYYAYKSEVKELESNIKKDDKSVKTCTQIIQELSKIIDQLTAESPEYINLLQRRIDECVACGRNQKINIYHSLVKEDIYQFIHLSTSPELIDKYSKILIDELRNVNNEIELVKNFSKFLTYPQFWEICQALSKSNSPLDAIAALDSFKIYYPAKSIKTNYTLELGKNYLRNNDIIHAETEFRKILTDWKFYELDGQNLSYVASLLPELSMKVGKFQGLEKIYADLPLKFLPEDYQNRGYISFLISKSINSKSVDSERYFLEIYSTHTAYDPLDQAGKSYYLLKLNRLVEIYNSTSSEAYLAELKKLGLETEYENFSKEKQQQYLHDLAEVLAKYRGELSNPMSKIKLKSTLLKVIKAKKDQKIENEIKYNYWELADLLMREDTLSADWNSVRDEISHRRKIVRDSLTYVEKLAEFRDIRCQKGDMIQVSLLNHEIIENCKNVPGFPVPNSMKDIGGNAILDVAKNLWFAGQFQELNLYLHNLFQTDQKKTIHPRQVSNILQEAYLLFGLSYEKQENCDEAKRIYSQAYNQEGLYENPNLSDILFERYKKIKCGQ